MFGNTRQRAACRAASRISLRVTATLTALTLLMLLLGGCGVRTQEKDTYRIGFFVYKGNDTFISNIYDSLSAIAADYVGENGERIYLHYADAQESQSAQKEQIERVISLGYDVLCVNLVDRTDAASVIDMAREANIPVVFFNRKPVSEDMRKWDGIVYVGTDARQTAELQAQIVVDAYQADPRAIDMDGDGVVQYIMLEGESRHQDALIRTETSVQALKDSGLRVEKLDGGIANWSRNQAAALCEQYFTTYGDKIELVLSNNDDMALGTVDALDRLGLDFDNIVGIDGTPQGLEAVEKGRMLGTVVVDYQKQSQLIFDLALALLKGESPDTIAPMDDDRTVLASLYIVTKEDA